MEIKQDEGFREEIWYCKVGGIIEKPIRPGGDFPMRRAIEKAFFELTGTLPTFIFSGWNAELTPGERDVVERQSHKPND